MYRAGIIKAYRYGYPLRRWFLNYHPTSATLTIPGRKNATIKKINEPCKVFSTTGTSLSFSAALHHLAISKRRRMWVSANNIFIRFM
jgi:hypothetical protein